jgi:hypothetical protein
MSKTLPASVLSLAQLLEQQSPAVPPCLVEPDLLPAQGTMFVGGEPKVGKSIGRYEIGSAFRGSSALHAVGDSYCAANPTVTPVQYRRTALPVSLCGTTAAAPGSARLGSALVLGKGGTIEARSRYRPP